jgi:hypothetical protein
MLLSCCILWPLGWLLPHVCHPKWTWLAWLTSITLIFLCNQMCQHQKVKLRARPLAAFNLCIVCTEIPMNTNMSQLLLIKSHHNPQSYFFFTTHRNQNKHGVLLSKHIFCISFH